MTTPTGLTTEEVRIARERFGANTLPQKSVRVIDLFMRQFRGVFNILLLVAATIALLLGEPFDAGFIILFVFVGVGLGFFQEFKSNKASEKLRSYLSRTCTVMRDGGVKSISIEDLVPGDVVRLEQGDMVPADAEVLEANGLLMNEESFTGEGVPVAKTSVHEGGGDTTLLLQGTVVVHGGGLARVTATGVHTRFAEIAKHTEAPEEKSILTQSVDRISIFVLRTTLVTLLFVLLGNVLIKGGEVDIPLLLIFAISLAVSVIPEALPLVSTFSLSKGALRLAQEKVIVKRLSSVQDLGSISILCTDKTGTITENKLVFKNQYYADGCPYTPQLLARFAANDVEKRVAEPFDIAVIEALSTEDAKTHATYTLLADEPFDPSVRSNGAVVRSETGEEIHVRRGAPEHILALTHAENEHLHAWVEHEERAGRRVLALAYGASGEALRFGGLLSFADTLKASTKSALHLAHDLHVRVSVITGDAKRVAYAVGEEAGLVSRADEVCTADEFFALSAHEQLRRVEDIRVFARTSPEQKLAIIELLKTHHTVGFLGEGINDAPALKAAHVSMVVQSASDIARETADIILLDSDLRVIIDGVRLGRETHTNVVKYIRATLISNFGNFYAVAVGSLLITFLPMLPKQILLLNLLSDLPMMTIAFDRVSRRDIARPQQYDFRSLWIVILVLGLVSTVFDFMFFALYYKVSPEVLQTNWFIGSVLTEILLLVSVRTLEPFYKAGFPARSIMFLSGGAFILTLCLPYIPFTAQFFEFAPPSFADLSLIVGLCCLYLIITELVKVPLARYLHHAEHGGKRTHITLPRA